MGPSPGRMRPTKSCLELVIVSVELVPFINELVVDSMREYAMKRFVFRNG